MIDLKGTGIQTPSGLDIELRNMTGTDWNNYVTQVVKTGEFYIQYGQEPTEELMDCISMMTPNVIYCSVYIKQNNTMVGYVGITPKTGNLEFYVFQEFRKRGIGTTAVDLLIRLWFSGRITGVREQEVKAETLSENLASIRLLEKLGFQKEAVGFRLMFSDESINQTIGLHSYILKNNSNC